MKKLLVAVCAIAALGLGSCGDGDKPSDPQRSAGEGVYAPEAKIETVLEDNVPTEVWLWSDETGRLEAIGDPVECGSYEERIRFSYDGDRVSKVAMLDDSLEMRVGYVGKYISSLTMMYGDVTGATVAVTHNDANKVSHLDVDLDESIISQLLQQYLSDSSLFAKHPVSRLVGEPAARSLMKVMLMHRPSARKMTVQDVLIGIDFEWSGDNVARAIASIELTVGVTMAEVGEVVDLESMLGSLAPLVMALPGEHPLTASIMDTLEFSYDNHPNPLQGFLGAVDVAILSANNQTGTSNYGTMGLTLTVTVPMIGEYPLSQSMPISRFSQTQYTYNEKGYPQTLTGDDGVVKEYQYKE